MTAVRTFEIVPGEGIPPIRFGMTPDDVRRVMGEPDRGSGPGGQPVVGAWMYGGLLVNTDDEDRVNYLELSRVPGIRAVYKGVSIWEVPMETAALLVCGGQPQDDFLCADFETDVAMTTCDGDDWDTIGIGTGSYFRDYWDRDQRRKRARDEGSQLEGA